jgi:hypothetical protein
MRKESQMRLETSTGKSLVKRVNHLQTTKDLGFGVQGLGLRLKDLGEEGEPPANNEGFVVDGLWLMA